MPGSVKRITVDLSDYPDLVVIYLGMRVNFLRGLKTLFGFGPRIQNAVNANPDGLLRHETFIISLFPLHVGMREYWRDYPSLEAWTRSEPHRLWWKKFLGDSGGTGFWHETYFVRGGMEAIYDDAPQPLCFLAFAPSREARGSMFSARQRLGIAGAAATPPPVPESDLRDGHSEADSNLKLET